MRRPNHLLAVGLAIAGGLGAVRTAAAPSVGIYFDAQATACSAPIVPFDPICLHAWVYVFPPPDSVLGGVALRLQLPASIEICANSIRFPHGFVPTGTLESGLVLRFDPCVSGGAPFLVAEFGLADVNAFPPSPSDLALHFVGTPIDTITSATSPRLLVCDPNDPEGQLGVIDVRSVDAILNCTQRCYCTTALVPRSWSAVKSLYREP